MPAVGPFRAACCPCHGTPSCPPVAHGRPTVEDEEERGKATMLMREEDAVGRACVDFTQRRGGPACQGSEAEHAAISGARVVA
jgi:hypothetical protein